MSAIAADNAIQAGFNGCDGIFRFAENPDLDHISGFPVAGWIIKTRRDYDTDGIFVENKAVHRAPPLKRAMIACRFDSL
jgi:hypothetical protein